MPVDEDLAESLRRLETMSLVPDEIEGPDGESC